MKKDVAEEKKKRKEAKKQAAEEKKAKRQAKKEKKAEEKSQPKKRGRKASEKVAERQKKTKRSRKTQKSAVDACPPPEDPSVAVEASAEVAEDEQKAENITTDANPNTDHIVADCPQETTRTSAVKSRKMKTLKRMSAMVKNCKEGSTNHGNVDEEPDTKKCNVEEKTNTSDSVGQKAMKGEKKETKRKESGGKDLEKKKKSKSDAKAKGSKAKDAKKPQEGSTKKRKNSQDEDGKIDKNSSKKRTKKTESKKASPKAASKAAPKPKAAPRRPGPAATTYPVDEAAKCLVLKTLEECKASGCTHPSFEEPTPSNGVAFSTYWNRNACGVKVLRKFMRNNKAKGAGMTQIAYFGGQCPCTYPVYELAKMFVPRWHALRHQAAWYIGEGLR